MSWKSSPFNLHQRGRKRNARDVQALSPPASELHWVKTRLQSFLSPKMKRATLRRRALEELRDLVWKSLSVYGLRDVAIVPSSDCPGSVLRGIITCYRNYRNMTRILVRFQFACQTHAVHDRHLDVCQHQVRCRSHHCTYCTERVLCLVNFITCLRQHQREQLEHVRIVFNNENFFSNAECGHNSWDFYKYAVGKADVQRHSTQHARLLLGVSNITAMPSRTQPRASVSTACGLPPLWRGRPGFTEGSSAFAAPGHDPLGGSSPYVFPGLSTWKLAHQTVTASSDKDERPFPALSPRLAGNRTRKKQLPGGPERIVCATIQEHQSRQLEASANPKAKRSEAGVFDGLQNPLLLSDTQSPGARPKPAPLTGIVQVSEKPIRGVCYRPRNHQPSAQAILISLSSA